MAEKFVVWNDTTNRFRRSTASVPDYRAGTATVANAATSTSVTFSAAFPNTSFAISCVWLNTTDSTPQFQPIIITAFSITGFTASWNAPADSANYKISWQALANS